MAGLRAVLFATIVCVWMHPLPTAAGVRVEEEEVVFSVRAPGARHVFLVGDFNNWNPTLEKMEPVGDGFEVRLFLLPGSYRYKYVVDGTWINDAENPPLDSSKGSFVVLVERAGQLTLASDEPSGAEGAPTLEPSVRYVGVFSAEDGKTRDDQAFDIFVGYEGKSVRSTLDVKSVGDTWDLSPAQADFHVDRGRLDVQLNGARIRAFENDSVWTSQDPFHVVGDVGTYRYNAGYSRKGFALEMPLILKTQLRALFGDRYETTGEVATIPAASVADFAGSASADTTIYRPNRSLDDEDTWALEFAASAGSVDLGWLARGDRGMHDGLLADIVRGNGDFAITSYSTREFWDADVFWGAFKPGESWRIAVAYGSGELQVRRDARSQSVVTSLGEIALAQDEAPAGSYSSLQSSRRWRGEVHYAARELTIDTAYEWTRFDFDAFTRDGSAAEIHEALAAAAVEMDRLRIGATMTYTDQSYGAAPDDFHFFATARNAWLDYGDLLDPSHVVAFDLDRSTSAHLDVLWRARRGAGWASGLSARYDMDVVSARFLRTVEFVSSRLAAEYILPRQLYVQADTRMAAYDKSSWGVSDVYVSPYAEVGYRGRGFEASVGFGLDPVVLDPVTNQFEDNGREEFLRTAISSVPLRSEAGSLGDAWLARERRLENIEAIKLEVILRF